MQALSWLINDNIADDVTVVIEQQGLNRLCAQIELAVAGEYKRYAVEL